MQLLYKFPLALCLAAGLSMSAPSVMAADKKHSKGKSASHQVVKKGSSSSVRAASGRGNQERQMATARRASGSNHRQMATARSRGDGNARRSSQVASASPRKIDRNVASARRDRSGRSADTRIARSQLASRSRNDNDSRVLRASRAASRVDRRSTAIASSSPSVRSSDITRYDRGDNHRGDRHRDRSSYRQRHEHHSADWYRSNGWRYDHDYYTSHRHHRYYNDLLGVFVIDNFGPGYGYGYDSGYGYGYSEPMVYVDNSGVGYETRVAVQDALAQAGYYNGPIDGVIGSGTRSAISNYQDDAGLIVTGMIDDSLMRSLGLY